MNTKNARLAVAAAVSAGALCAPSIAQPGVTYTISDNVWSCTAVFFWNPEAYMQTTAHGNAWNITLTLAPTLPESPPPPGTDPPPSWDISFTWSHFDTPPPPQHGEGPFTGSSGEWTVLESELMGLHLQSFDVHGDHDEIWSLYFDRSLDPANTRITVTIQHTPTPGAAGLLGLGGLCAMRRRR